MSLDTSPVPYRDEEEEDEEEETDDAANDNNDDNDDDGGVTTMMTREGESGNTTDKKKKKRARGGEGTKERHRRRRRRPTPSRPRLGQLIEASPLDGAKASGVTCVKFSPSAEFCLLGYGVRENSGAGNNNPNNPSGGGGGGGGNNNTNNNNNSAIDNDDRYHPVTALYRVRGGMRHVSTMLSGDDDVNIARFHPDSGYGFVYGTKQGRVRVLSSRPWNYYHC